MDPDNWDLGNPKGPEKSIVRKAFKNHVWKDHKWSSKNKQKEIAKKVLQQLILDGKDGFSKNGNDRWDSSK